MTNDRSWAPDQHRETMTSLYHDFTDAPIPEDQRLDNIGLFLPPAALEQIIGLYQLYQMARYVPGHMVEFGSRWGRNIVTMATLWRIHEPRDTARRFIAFDTFDGLKGVTELDGSNPRMTEGQYAVSEGYAEWYAEHLKRTKLPVSVVVGDVTKAAAAWFDSEPGAQVALAYFDMDIYQPTRAALEAVMPRLLAGSVLAFDEYAHSFFPGETVAVREVLGGAPLRRLDGSPHVAYVVVE